MATKLKDVDAVMVGMGWTGAIMARELTKAGLTVVGLERGQDRNPKEEFGLTTLRDELRYVRRLELMQDNSIDTITFRNEPTEAALPIRRIGDDYPNKPVKTGLGPSIFRDAAKGLGYPPFPLPVATSSAPYVNPEGVTLGACEYCGHCNRTACEANAKASPNVNVLSALRGNPKFELRTRAFVTRLVYDKAGKKVTGVLYTD